MNPRRKTIQAWAIAAAALCLTGAPLAAQSVLDEWATVKAPPPPVLKPVTLDAKKTAYMVLDFRLEACTKERRPRCAASLPHVEKLLTEARAKGMMVVHTLTTSSKEESIPPALKPIAGEQVLAVAMDKMSAPGLAESLKAKGIDTVLISGTSGNNAVMNTAAGAVLRGFKAIVPVDTMPSEGAYQEQFAVWQIANGSTLREMATVTRSDMVTIK